MDIEPVIPQVTGDAFEIMEPVGCLFDTEAECRAEALDEML
jgi:hypothetical protein